MVPTIVNTQNIFLPNVHKLLPESLYASGKNGHIGDIAKEVLLFDFSAMSAYAMKHKII